MKDKVLNELKIRLIRLDERELCEKYISEYHYLEYKGMIGKTLKYVATINENWVVLIGWGSPSLICKARDEYIGWHYERKTKRLITS